MSSNQILSKIQEFADKLPKFDDGRIDYSNSDTAPVITVFVKYKDKILLLKRSNKVNNYPSKWNTVSGYLDEVKPIKNKILEELSEKERYIIVHRFGLKEEGKAQTLEEIGRVFGLSRERIRQIEKKTLDKLKSLIDSEAGREALA